MTNSTVTRSTEADVLGAAGASSTRAGSQAVSGASGAPGAQADFLPLAEPYRRELLAHCYRMLGSVHDAEDLVQETYLRGWRAYENFEGRSSLRTWLYRIATSACLTALESRGRRPLPTGLGQPSSDPEGELVQRDEVPWLEPVPDTMVELTGDPAAVAGSRESVRLALIAALQHLPPRQRAALILHDVLRWRAAEVAEMLGTSTAAVNSALQRARAQMGSVSPSEDTVEQPTTPEQRQLLDRYVAAFESYDVPALLELFAQDAVWEMPPFTGWYHTRQAIGRLIRTQCPAKTPGDLRLVPTRANGQPAFGVYLRDSVDPGKHASDDAGAVASGVDDGFSPFQLQVLTMGRDGAVEHVAAFFDTSLFPLFGLPDHLPEREPGAPVESVPADAAAT